MSRMVIKEIGIERWAFGNSGFGFSHLQKHGVKLWIRHLRKRFRKHAQYHIPSYILLFEAITSIVSIGAAYFGYLTVALGIALIGLFFEHRFRQWEKRLLIEEAAEEGAEKLKEEQERKLRRRSR